MARQYKFQTIMRKKFTDKTAKYFIEKVLMAIQNEIEFLQFYTAQKLDGICGLAFENETIKAHIDTLNKYEMQIMYASQFLDTNSYVAGRYIQKMPLDDMVMDLLKKVCKEEYKCTYDFKEVKNG